MLLPYRFLVRSTGTGKGIEQYEPIYTADYNKPLRLLYLYYPP